MKVKDLIEELQKFNPDGVVTVEILHGRDNDCMEAKAQAVEDSACSMVNPVIVAK